MGRFLVHLLRLENLIGNIEVFFMAGPIAFPGNSDRQFISACAPFSGNSSCKTFNNVADLMWSGAIRSALQILERAFFTTF